MEQILLLFPLTFIFLLLCLPPFLFFHPLQLQLSLHLLLHNAEMQFIIGYAIISQALKHGDEGRKLLDEVIVLLYYAQWRSINK
jgi:hypothetical protein